LEYCLSGVPRTARRTMLDIHFIRIEVDANVKVVCGHGGAIPRRPLQDIEPFENQDLGLVYGLKLSWDNIVTTHGSRQAPEAPTSLLLAPPETPSHSFEIIAFWKALTTH